MKNMKKILVLALAAVLLVAVGVGGTLAWLTDTTSEITNTFTESDVDIELSESSTTKQFKMIPGVDITKDPKVTVKNGSEACYVFVKVTEDGEVTVGTETKKFDDFLTYALASGWNFLDTTKYGNKTDNANDTYVIYKKQAETTADTALQILANDKVSVKDSVNKAMMDVLTDENYPTLTFQAWAIQQANGTGTTFTAAEAWTALGTP